MALKKGETYRCPDEDCGCEIAVTKGPALEGGNQHPRCCCGMEMEKTHQESRRSADRGDGRSESHHNR
jgi:hypothetical protein